MAKIKFYAVRKGFTPGVYTTWAEAEKQVKGFIGAEHKSFDSYEAADAWICGRDNAADEVKELLAKGLTVVYTDGSSNGDAYSYAALIITPDGKENVLSGKGADEDALRSRNVAGELSAVMHAVAWCKKNGSPDVVIFHDYEGCSAWAEGRWKSSSALAASYVKYLLESRLRITFRKVSGHSGNSYNERVDKLARQALSQD